MSKTSVAFLFWNLQERPRTDVVVRLTQVHDVDVVILAECAIPGIDLVGSLKERVDHRFHKPWSLSVDSKLTILSRLSQEALQPVSDDNMGRVALRRLIVGPAEFLLGAVHLTSKAANWTELDQAQEAQIVAGLVRDAEKEAGHERTLLIGDLNMNPFEPGLVSSHAFNAVMTKHIARGRRRKVQGRLYPFFYNPMWGYFGDQTPGPPGTLYFRQARPIMYFWNIFDQVLIRPALLDAFQDDLRILDTDGTMSLVGRDGRPDQAVASDHLPILLRLHF